MLTIRPRHCSTNHGREDAHEAGERDGSDIVLLERGAQRLVELLLAEALALQRPGLQPWASGPVEAGARSGLFEATSATS